MEQLRKPSCFEKHYSAANTYYHSACISRRGSKQSTVCYPIVADFIITADVAGTASFIIFVPGEES